MNNINIASVGLGLWGKNVLRVSSNVKNARLAAICDSNPDELTKYSAIYPSAKIYHDYSEILNSDEINAVLLATPAPMHFSMAMQALHAGKHVYVEKTHDPDQQ